MRLMQVVIPLNSFAYSITHRIMLQVVSFAAFPTGLRSQSYRLEHSPQDNAPGRIACCIPHRILLSVVPLGAFYTGECTKLYGLLYSPAGYTLSRTAWCILLWVLHQVVRIAVFSSRILLSVKKRIKKLRKYLLWVLLGITSIVLFKNNFYPIKLSRKRTTLLLAPTFS